MAEWLEWLSIHVVSHVYSIFSFWLAMRDGVSAFAFVMFYLQTFSIILSFVLRGGYTIPTNT